MRDFANCKKCNRTPLLYTARIEGEIRYLYYCRTVDCLFETITNREWQPTLDEAMRDWNRLQETKEC